MRDKTPVSIVKDSGQTVDTLWVDKGANLRSVLIQFSKFELYNDPFKRFNCHGFGTCGTCSVQLVEGVASPVTSVERWRLNFPPHQNSLQKGLRLACQVQVESPIKIKKLSGRWGQGHTDFDSVKE